MKIYELLDTSDRWTKGWYSKDVNGDIVEVDHPSARKWCLEGAVAKCYPSYERRNVLFIIASHIGKSNISQWNDTHTYEEVIELVKELDI